MSIPYQSSVYRMKQLNVHYLDTANVNTVSKQHVAERTEGLKLVITVYIPMDTLEYVSTLMHE